MRIKPLPKLDELKKFLEYDPLTGVFRWKLAKSNKIKVGEVAGSTDSQGHLQVKFGGEMFFLHRIAWFIMTGEDPGENQIDHDNTIRADNRWLNLRLATHNRNAHNANKRSDNTSGVKGVGWNNVKKAWIGRVAYNKKTYRTGSYQTVTEAETAIKILREKLHKEFTHHG